MTVELDLTAPLPEGRLVIEASAGTGKTYSLSALVVRHVAERGVAASALLVVTFTKAAAAELGDRSRKALVQALAACEDGAAPADQPWMSVLLEPAAAVPERTARLRAAIATFDDATITTIHGFCQQTLRQLGLRSGVGLNAELGDSTAQIVDEVCRDLIVTELVANPHVLDWPKNDGGPTKVLKELQRSVTAVLGNPGAVAAPAPGAFTPHKDDTPARLERWIELVHLAVDEVGRRRRARQELGYDDLITGLRDAVTDPVNGPSVVEALNSRYQLVLVDEFQDTDPVQWQIFEHTFTGNLVTVGDPKQAIYRFRGADVHAYLKATEGADTMHLGTNFRSDADLVNATSSLISGVHLGDERIVGTAVAAASNALTRSLSPGAPLEIRWLADDPLLHSSKGVSAPLARRSIIADLVLQIVELFEFHTIDTGLGPVPVQPGDIAILVQTHSQAAEIVESLRRAGIPSVRTRTGSVLRSPAANEWGLLLAALERPAHAPTVRAASFSVFFHQHAADLDPLNPDSEPRLAALQQRCAGWAEQLTTQPFLAWYDHVRGASEMVPTVLAAQGGERELTDLDHIAELLAGEFPGVGATPAAVRRTLDRLRAGLQQGDDADAQMRRIDSDAAAVQVTTLHGSKGLEYPVVLLPFNWQTPNSFGPTIYHEPTTGRRVVDIATGQGWNGLDTDSTENGRKHYAKAEARGDLLRLLYVGLTRAKRRTIVWWAGAKDAQSAALNVMLFDRDADGEPLCTAPTLDVGPRGGVKSNPATIASPDDAGVTERLAQLVARSDGLISATAVPALTHRVRWLPDLAAPAPPALAVASTNGRVIADTAWRRWSFTSITRTLERDWSATASIAGGADEPTPADDSLVATATATATAGVGAVPMPLADVLAGAAFGTLVHSVLERLDPASNHLSAELAAEVTLQLRRDRLQVPAHDLIAGLSAALHTSLGPLTDGLRLVDIRATDRLAELDFDLPLATVSPRVNAKQIGEVLLATLTSDDPQRAYAQVLADGRFDLPLAGFLQGSIDAVLRVPDPVAGHRYVVVDYKTNRLHAKGAAAPLAAYHPDLLPAEMAHSDYPLQSILYSVALHRYLRWRLPSYLPEQHLGGIAYLFVRGMVGADTPLHEGHPYGVFSWRPPAATVVALDRLLATGEWQ
ncbi:MAG: AAA family ATPase [Actinobacteria bacterium]|uniref:DNA 3'-5' helicase n=1 Tax=freshwater metagenome TaxID=449393 RepID=A0A6J6SJG7_9ZZZZ|nr:AAA family ATPase [Actinomycetota bacterium]MSW79206.1 AAA family ATPase [Actinomycetota bacterium]MSX55284.1 AAA family ATPase [Actinomycetota bacterium]MSZ83874.1 AAA family ATPase [Actinomycetota bacterium]